MAKIQASIAGKLQTWGPCLGANGAALVEAMHQAYPDAGLRLALEIGAKVDQGETAW